LGCVSLSFVVTALPLCGRGLGGRTMFCFVAAAFWGCASLLFVVAAFSGRAMILHYGHSLSGPRNVFCFVSAAFGATRPFSIVATLFGPHNDSVLWARPFRAARCLVLSPRLVGPHVVLFVVTAQSGRAKNPPFGAARCFVVVGAAFQGCSLPLSVIMTFSSCVTILLCGRGLSRPHTILSFVFVAAAFSGPHIKFSIVAAFLRPGDDSVCWARPSGHVMSCFFPSQGPFGTTCHICLSSRP